jgi:signal transduction histidine kinase
MHRILLRVLLALAATAGWSQRSAARPTLRTYGVEQGLASPALLAVAQDDRGLLWVGGETGLFLFDGQRFHNLELPVRERFVRRIWPQKDGSLLVDTLEALVRIWPDGRQPARVEFPRPGTGTLLQQLEDGRIFLEIEGVWKQLTLGGQPEPVAGWEKLPPMLAFTHTDAGLNLTLGPNRVWIQKGPGQTPQEIPAPAYRSGEHPLDITQDGTGRLWLRTSERCFHRDGEGPWREGPTIGRFTGNGLILDTDAEGWVWLFGNEGITRVRGDDQQTYAIGPLGAFVNAVRVDREGTPWLATQDGLVQILGQGLWSVSDADSGLPSPLVWSIHRDARDQLWVGTQAGMAVLRDRTWRTVTSGRMTRISQAPDGSVWFGGNPGDRIHRGDPRTLGITSFPTPFRERNELLYGLAHEGGSTWLLSNRNHLVRSRSGPPFRWEPVEVPKGLGPHPFWALTHPRPGALFLGANGSLFHRSEETWRTVEGTLPQVPVLTAMDPQGRLVVGYLSSRRLTVHALDAGTYRKVAEWEALERPDDPLIIYALAFDPRGNLWVGTSLGLAVLDPQGRKVAWHEPGGGIPSGDVNFLCLRVEDQALWVGTPKGLGRFEHARHRKPLTPPLPILMEVQAQGRSVTGPVELPRRANQLAARFVVPTYLNPASLVLEYRLNQGPWRDMESSRLRLESLSSGAYILEVRGRDLYGQEGPALPVPFEVRPGWWERVWFWALVALAAIGIAVGLVRWRSQALLRQNELLQQEVALRTRELESASRAKSAFLADMSHELRTPLNAILLYSELLREFAEERQDEEMATDTRRIQYAGKHLLSLVNGILDLSKIEAGKMDVAQEILQPALVLQETAAALGMLALQRGNALTVEAAADLPLLTTDGTKLRQILMNLAGNACKFTEAGSITLRAQRCGDGLQFEVEDTGIGLTQDQLARIFRPYEQAEGSTYIKFGGTGLGLTLSLKLAQLLGGTLTVRSEPGKGTCFTLTLPTPQP